MRQGLLLLLLLLLLLVGQSVGWFDISSGYYRGEPPSFDASGPYAESGVCTDTNAADWKDNCKMTCEQYRTEIGFCFDSCGGKQDCCFCGGGDRERVNISVTDLCYDLPGWRDTSGRGCTDFIEDSEVRCYEPIDAYFPQTVACCACGGGTRGKPLCIDERQFNHPTETIRDSGYNGCWVYDQLASLTLTTPINITQKCLDDGAWDHCWESCGQCTPGIEESRTCPFCDSSLCVRQPYRFMNSTEHSSYQSQYMTLVESHCSLSGPTQPGCECCTFDGSGAATCPLADRCDEGEFFGFCKPESGICAGLAAPTFEECVDTSDGSCHDDPRFDLGFGSCELYEHYRSEELSYLCAFEGADTACPLACGTCSSCVGQCGTDFRHERQGFNVGCGCNDGCVLTGSCCSDYFGVCLSSDSDADSSQLITTGEFFELSCNDLSNNTISLIPLASLGGRGDPAEWQSFDACSSEACAGDLQICSDGATTVGRSIALGCDFEACPDEPVCGDESGWLNWATLSKGYLGCWAYETGNPADRSVSPLACTVDQAAAHCRAACGECEKEEVSCAFCDSYMCLVVAERRSTGGTTAEIAQLITEYCSLFDEPSTEPGCSCCSGSGDSFVCSEADRCWDPDHFGACSVSGSCRDPPTLLDCVPQTGQGVCENDPRFNHGFGNCTFYEHSFPVSLNEFCSLDGALEACPNACGECNSCKGICGTFDGTVSREWDYASTSPGCSCNANCRENDNCCADYEDECLCIFGCVNGECVEDGSCRCDLGWRGLNCTQPVVDCPSHELFDVFTCNDGSQVYRLPERSCAFDDCPKTACADLEMSNGNSWVSAFGSECSGISSGPTDSICYETDSVDGRPGAEACCLCGGGYNYNETIPCLPSEYHSPDNSTCLSCEDEQGWLNFSSVSGVLGCWGYHPGQPAADDCFVDGADAHCPVACGDCSREEQICPFCDAYLCLTQPLEDYWNDVFGGAQKRWLFQTSVEDWCTYKGLEEPGCECCVKAFDAGLNKDVTTCDLDRRCGNAPYVGFCKPDDGIGNCTASTSIAPALGECKPEVLEGYCVDNPLFYHGWGNCTLYELGHYGHDFCDIDHATDECKLACGSCTTCKGRCGEDSKNCSCRASCVFSTGPDDQNQLPCCRDYSDICVCPNNCTGHGACLQDECVCDPGWELGPGWDCSQPTCQDWSRYEGDIDNNKCNDYSNNPSLCALSGTRALGTPLFLQYGIDASDACCACGGGYYGVSNGSCSGNCGEESGGCWCDDNCREFGDCCSDFFDSCPTESCLDDPQWYSVDLILKRGFSGCWAYASGSGAEDEGTPMHDFCVEDGAQQHCPVACGVCVPGDPIPADSEGRSYGPTSVNPLCSPEIGRKLPTDLEIERFGEDATKPMERFIESWCSLQLSVLGVETNKLTVAQTVPQLQTVPGCECCYWTVDLSLVTRDEYLSCPQAARCTQEPHVGWCRTKVDCDSNVTASPPTVAQCLGITEEEATATCYNDPRFSRGFGGCDTYYPQAIRSVLFPEDELGYSNYWACEADGAADRCPVACGACDTCSTAIGPRCGEPVDTGNCSCVGTCEDEMNCCGDFNTTCGLITGCLGLPFDASSPPCVDQRCFAGSFELATQHCKILTCAYCAEPQNYNDEGCVAVQNDCVDLLKSGYCVSHVDNELEWRDDSGNDCDYYMENRTKCHVILQRDGSSPATRCCNCFGGDFCFDVEGFVDGDGNTCAMYKTDSSYRDSHCGLGYRDDVNNITSREACCGCDSFGGAGATAGVFLPRPDIPIGDPCDACGDVMRAGQNGEEINPSNECLISIVYPCLIDLSRETYCAPCAAPMESAAFNETSSSSEQTMMNVEVGADGSLSEECKDALQAFLLQTCFGLNF